MPIRENIPDEAKNRVRENLLRTRANAEELQETAQEMDGLVAMLLEGLATRIINLIDIALEEL